MRVCREEVEGFVGASESVRNWLGRFAEGRSRYNCAYVLCRFFKWLRVRKGLRFSAEGLLNEHLRKRNSLDVDERRWASGLVLQFARDNPDFAGLGRKRKYHMFIIIKSFFDFCEAPLSTAKNVFGGHNKVRKYKPKQVSVEQARRILGLLNQRDRTILLCMLQSGMSAGDVLNKFNPMLDYVVGRVKAGAQRIRIDLAERKGNCMPYFTFISRDAIQELKKWLQLRSRILEQNPNGESEKLIFITKKGTPLTLNTFEISLTYHFHKHKLTNGPFQVTSHMFRKLFKTEASPPERGIDRDCVEFMMGHLSGIQAVGGVYDRTPELYAGVIEREYAKLEPYINIYSGKTAPTKGLDITKEDAETLKQLLKMFKQGKITVEL